MSTIVEIVSNIEDVNEYAPVFPEPYIQINISESSSINDVITIDDIYLAKDADAGTKWNIYRVLATLISL